MREIIVIGAGPAGLSAAIEAAKTGADVCILDENLKPGGQLFKQIHKFFGSKEHLAGTRGFEIGNRLLQEAEKLNISIFLNTEVLGIDKNKNIWAIKNKKKTIRIKGKKIILATGAMEKPINFKGWTLPGVMGAGAAQTMINIHRVLPGEKVLILGSGNVGVIVGYQLLQAGADVVAVVEGSSRLGAYGVHTAKLKRAGVPFYTSHTIYQAIGENHVEAVEIVKVDEYFKQIKGTKKTLEADTICIATGLTPVGELAWILGCQFEYIKELGGYVPLHNENMETTVKDIYIAGDISGIEEASTAMEEGRLAGVNAAKGLGYNCDDIVITQIWDRINTLRMGPFGEKRKDAKDYILRKGRMFIN